MAGAILLLSLWSSTRKPSPYPSSPFRLFTKLNFFSRAFSAAASPAATTGSLDPSHLRNVAVIAHVDHGKTTLMDRLLRQCGADIPHERAMDSNSLKRERGITIASKVTTISWKENELNMVDTPGHADFGGEVERVIGMVEGAVLVVDAGEGPLAQTKFVLAKALKYGLWPILLLNKVDQPSVTEETCNEVESLVFDLFANLGATEEQLDFAVLYASAKEGWASTTFTKDPPDEAKNMSQLLDAIVTHVPPPKASIDAPFKMLVSMMERDFYLGRILTGRIYSGVVRVGDRVHGLRNKDSVAEKIEDGKVVKLMKKKGTNMVLTDCAGAGDIVSMAGLASPSIGHTVATVEVMSVLPTVEIDPPTISMTFGVNDSPLAGRDGTHLTGGRIGDRLVAEAETNLAINVLPGLSESFEVQGRGELQLGILIENMRREGFESSVSPPKVMYKTENGQKLEPIEEVTIEVNDEHVGLVMEALSHRRAEVPDMGPVSGTVGRTRLSLTCPSRGLVGYRSVFSSDTRGTGFMHRAFFAYEKFQGPLGNVRKGVLVSMGYGTITAHALMSLEARGTLFVAPGMETYDGMIVGEHSRDTDVDVNPVRAKELTNVRAASKDENVKLTPRRLVSMDYGTVTTRGTLSSRCSCSQGSNEEQFPFPFPQKTRSKSLLSRDIVHSTLSRCPSDLIALSFFLWSAQHHDCFDDSLSFDCMFTVLRCLIHRYKTLKAILFELESIGCATTPKTFLLLLRIFWQGGMHAMVLEAYHHMEAYGFLPNTFARNLLIDVLFRIGRTDLALRVFKDTHAPNFFTFNTALLHLSKLNDVTNINPIARGMLRMGYYPNPSTFEMLINCFCKTQRVVEAYQVLGLMITLGIKMSVNVWTILIHKYCNLGRLDIASKMLWKMAETGCSPNVVTYTTLFKALMESNMVTDAFDLLNIMLSSGQVPDLILCNVLIDRLSKVGRYRDAIEVFVSLSKQNIKPDSYTFSSLLSTICLSRMFYLLPKLVYGHIDADLVVCNALLSSFIKAGLPSLAVEFYNHMIDKGFAPDKYSFTGLLSGLCAAGRIDEAVNVYRGVVMTYHDTDAHIHTVITGELIKVGKYHRAAGVFRLAIMEKWPLDSVAYTVGIRALLRGGRTQEACTLYDQMKDNGLTPNVHTCNMMLFTFFKEKDLQMVKQMLQDMIDSQIQLSDRNFLNFFKFPCSLDNYHSVLKLLAEMGDLGLLSAKALHALSFDVHVEGV